MLGTSPRLSGLVFLDKAHGVDSSASQAFRDVSGQQKGHAMQHQNSVFHELLKYLPWAEFDRLVERHDADFRIRTLPTKSQLIALLYGQLSGAASLREIVGGLESHAARLYNLGAKPVARSTLSDANTLRPSALFAELFALLVERAHRGLRRNLADTVYLIDSTGLRLTAASQWARFSTKVWGAKLHVIYDPGADRPIYAAISTAKVNDITAAQAMPIEPGATYVFDLGYYDYRWWASLDEKACRIVTRFKANTPLQLVEERPVPPDARWVKQVLKITQFLGTSENAVRIQIAVALIAFLLLRMAQATQSAIESPLAFARLVRTNLMHRRRIDRLLSPPTTPVLNPNQLAIQWT
jgi:hypothetical protein